MSTQDAVFGVRRSLIADWKPQPDGSYLVEYDFVLNPAGRRPRQAEAMAAPHGVSAGRSARRDSAATATAKTTTTHSPADSERACAMKPMTGGPIISPK